MRSGNSLWPEEPGLAANVVLGYTQKDNNEFVTFVQTSNAKKGLQPMTDEGLDKLCHNIGFLYIPCILV